MSRGHKILVNFANCCAWFWGKGFVSYLSVICKDFLHLFCFLVLHCFLEALLIYSSIVETKEVGS